MDSSVGNWLDQHGLGQFAEVFEANEIDLDAARDLTEEDLRELGIAMGPRKKLLRAIFDLAPDQYSEVFTAEKKQSAELSQKAESLGEYRQITVLFADISGYTALSARLDSEEIYKVLEAYFGVVDAIVEDYGGTVDKHIGDSVMAVFGAPVAHGNDAERAARAALAIQQAIPEISEKAGLPIKVHIGIASGQVVASQIGTEKHYTVTGASVNLASRLTDQAKADEIYLSSAVQRMVGSACKTDDIGELSLKGIAEPVRVFKLLSFDVSSDLQKARPFVGRQPEMQQYSAAVEACLGDRTGCAFYLRGEAGIGKTRLAEEFERHATDRGFRSHRALILDFGAGKGQDAIRSLVRSLLSIPLTSEKEELLARAAEAVENDCIREDQSVFLYDLLDLEPPREQLALYNAMENSKRNQGKQETLGGLVRSTAKLQPLILIIEDLHWADKLVLDHLSELTKTIEDLPVILVMTSRIEGDPLTGKWRASSGSTPVITIDLRPLKRGDALRLAAEFFDVAKQFASTCVERADGNPLFLEQLLRGAETAADVSVPESVQSIVQARMDALDATDKYALQAASILGQRFSLDALRHLIGSNQYSGGHLIERYLIRPDGSAFLFAHALVHEGVYNSLLISTRRELHRRAAEWYRTIDPILYAQHLERADDPLAGEAYLDAAIVQASELRFEAAAQLARQGLELTQDQETLCDLRCKLGDALLNIGSTEEAIEVYTRATEDAVNNQQRCAAWTGLASVFRLVDQQTKALEALENAEKASREQQLQAELAFIHYLRGNLYFPLGRGEECLEEHESSYKLAREVGSLEAEARALSGLGDAHYLKGRMITACDNFKACVRLAEDNGYGRIAVANRHMVGWSRIYQMEFHEALEDGKVAARTASQVSQRRAEIAGLLLAGTMEQKLGNLESAACYLEKSAACAQRVGSANFLANIYWQLSMVRARQGDSRVAFEIIQKTLDTSREFGMTFVGPAVLATWASLCGDGTDRQLALEEAEELLDSGCVAHNQVWFAEEAIEDAILHQEFDRAARYADRLESFTRKEPLPFADFIVERARVLIDCGRKNVSDNLVQRINKLIDRASGSGLAFHLPALEEALSIQT